MILQKLIMPVNLDMDYRVYYRALGEVYEREHNIVIPAGETFCTDTYMNAFDIGAWKKYTEVKSIFLRIKIGGKGKLAVYQECKESSARVLHEVVYDTLDAKNKEEYCLPLTEELNRGIIYFEIQAEETSLLEDARFETWEHVVRDIRIGVVICTYKRRLQLEKLLKEICPQDDEADAKWLNIKVIDNSSELDERCEKNLQVYHNPNTGGSGGFSRGMDEVVRDLKRFPATHVVLMDDDVILQKESLYRLYALLSYMKENHGDEVIAGRMFRLDQPWIQYTAVEIWNAGDIRHIGWNQDMTERECLWDMNENSGGEYGGWWFACYPIGFVKENRPMPFFLHCDDVEYGLRHGGTPIILNGIQVWHETYEYRQSPVMLYYDTRNTLLVNELLREHVKDKDTFDFYQDILKSWKQKITAFHLKKDWLSEYYVIIALRDWMRGQDWLKRSNSAHLHKKLKKYKTVRLKNAIAWRYVEYRFNRYYLR